MHPKVRATAEAMRGLMRREIVLPFVGGVIALVAVVLLTVIITGPERMPFVSNFLLTFLILLPLALCMFPLYMLTVIATFVLWRLASRTTAPLQRIEYLSVRMSEGAERISQAAARRGIALDAEAARLEKLLDVFNRPERPVSPTEPPVQGDRRDG
jgi:hypothetical protein